MRATEQGVTGNPLLRANITFSSVPESARTFYQKDMMNGFFGRIPFAYKARGERKGKIPRQGDYDEDFLRGNLNTSAINHVINASQAVNIAFFIPVTEVTGEYIAVFTEISR